MHRNKFGTEYDTLPGGGVEAVRWQWAAAQRRVGFQAAQAEENGACQRVVGVLVDVA